MRVLGTDSSGGFLNPWEEVKVSWKKRWRRLSSSSPLRALFVCRRNNKSTLHKGDAETKQLKRTWLWTQGRWEDFIVPSYCSTDMPIYLFLLHKSPKAFLWIASATPTGRNTQCWEGEGNKRKQHFALPFTEKNIPNFVSHLFLC